MPKVRHESRGVGERTGGEIMTQQVSSEEIKAAGGLDAWMRKQTDKRTVAVVPPKKPKPEAELANLRNLSNSPAAKGRLPKDSFVGYDVERMNGLEAKYAGYLEAQRWAGKILFWRYESVKFRLADRTWYTPDFYIMRPDGSIEIHETKGHWEDDARVKIKATAEQFPEFFFVAVQWKKGEWQLERFRAGGNQ